MSAIPFHFFYKALGSWSVWLLSIFFFFPLIVATLWVFLPAWGYLPVLGFNELGWDVWKSLKEIPGLITSIRLTVFIGAGATVLTFFASMLIVTACYTSGYYKTLQNVLAPLLAIPHLTLAAGLMFLLTPGGFFFRLLASYYNWEKPPSLNIVPDHWGVVMLLLLCLKEIPFLLFIINGALSQINLSSHLRVAASLGYSPFSAWWKIIWPQVYPRIRLPLFIIMVFSFVSVDIALMLAPNAPPPLSVRLLDWYSGNQLEERVLAAAGGILLSSLVVGTALFWIMGEFFVKRVYAQLIMSGKRGGHYFLSKCLAWFLLLSVVLLGFGSLIIMLLWSFAEHWRFPSLLPESWQITYWINCYLCAPIYNSVFIAFVTSVISIITVIGLLEYLHQREKKINVFWFYIPLLLPQIVFIFGFDLLLLSLQLNPYLKVIWAHWIYSLPYVFLIINLSYQRLDRRYEQVGYCLGASRLRILFGVKLPILFRPMLYAFAIAFAVSINEYLPTLIPGKGRVVTLTTEMANLASGGDRRIIGVTGVFQAVIPLCVFGIALLLPELQSRSRRGLQV